MGMQIVDCSDASHPIGASAFLSSRPREESHQIDLTKTEEELMKELKVLTGRKDFTSPTVFKLG